MIPPEGAKELLKVVFIISRLILFMQLLISNTPLAYPAKELINCECLIKILISIFPTNKSI